jgi:hypothetical protein
MDISRIANAFNVGQMAAIIFWLYWYFRDRGEIRERLVRIEQKLEDGQLRR